MEERVTVFMSHTKLKSRISFKVDKSGNKNLKCIKANTKKDISD